MQCLRSAELRPCHEMPCQSRPLRCHADEMKRVSMPMPISAPLCPCVRVAMPCPRLASLCCANAVHSPALPLHARSEQRHRLCSASPWLRCAVHCHCRRRCAVPMRHLCYAILSHASASPSQAKALRVIASPPLCAALPSHCGALPSIASPQLTNASPSPCAPMPCQCWSVLCPCRALIALLRLRAEAVRPAGDVAHDDARDDGRREQDCRADRAPDVLHGGKLLSVPVGTLSLVAALGLPTYARRSFSSHQRRHSDSLTRLPRTHPLGMTDASSPRSIAS